MILRATRLSATGSNGGATPIISGFAYPANALTSTVAGQWFVDNIAVIGETGSTYTVRLTDIGLPIRCGNSNVLTCWHPNQIAAVARFWWASRNALNSVSPDVLATNGQTVRRWNGIISSTPADQTSAPSQPIWRSAGQSGNPSIEFDGVDDRFDLPSNSDVFQNRSQGYLIAGCRDLNPSGAGPVHPVAFYSRGSISVANRIGIVTRLNNNNVFGAVVRRNDADAAAIASASNNGDYNVLGVHGDWSNGFARLRINGSVAASTALPSGSGLTENTPGTVQFIGNDNGPSNYFPGHITAVCAINASISATDLSRIERFIGLLGGLNIPLV